MLKSAIFRFHESLNDFLPSQQRNSWINYSFYVPPSIKNTIEALGAPHVEVAMILVNQIPVDYSYRLQMLVPAFRLYRRMSPRQACRKLD